MKIFLYYIGKARDPHSNALAADFVGRIKHYATIVSSEIRPERFDPFAKHPAARKILLDPAGAEMDSNGFANLIRAGEMKSQDFLFLVGGHSGVPPAWRARADQLLSLSAMTFPHELARAMLAEQIYRAFSILRGNPYPR